MPKKSSKKNNKSSSQLNPINTLPWHQRKYSKFLLIAFIIFLFLFFKFSSSNNLPTDPDSFNKDYQTLIDYSKVNNHDLQSLLIGVPQEIGISNAHKKYLMILKKYPESIHALYGLFLKTEYMAEFEESLNILEKLKKLIPLNQVIDEKIKFIKEKFDNELSYSKKLEEYFFQGNDERFLRPSIFFGSSPKFSKDLQQKIEIIHTAVKKHKESDGFEAFLIKSRRLYGIETGQIESLYMLTKEITMQLIELGISSEIIFHDENHKDYSEEEKWKKSNEISDIIHDNIQAFLEIERIIYEKKEITVDLINGLHKIFTTNARYFSHPKEGIKLLRRGKFKLRPNTVYIKNMSKYILFTAPSKVKEEINQLIMNLMSKIKMNEEVFGIAGWLHCAFIGIHPFDDGNGRVARALTSIVLGKAGFLPFTVPPEMKEEYHNAINEFLLKNDLLPIINLIVIQQEYVIKQFGKLSR